MKRFALSLAVLLSLPLFAGADWLQFRNSGNPVGDERSVPTQWNADSNLLWTAKLPGPGASSPVILGDRVYVTCYSGYGTSAERAGDRGSLVRHLLCLNRGDGKILWKEDIHSKTPEAGYQGMMTQHGYASNTPATDGERIYLFLGTAGAYAFDLSGKQAWHTGLGTGTDQWGSAASVVLHDDLVIVNAAIESGTVVALHKADGKEAWKFKVSRRSWSTPAIVESADGKKELVISSEGRISGIDPKSGKETWFCDGIQDYTCPSVTAGKGVAYVSGGRQSSVIAIRTGGSGDVSGTHVLWKSRLGANVTTPLVYKNHVYGVADRGIAYCIDAETGKTVYQERLASATVAARPAAFQQPPPGKKRFGGKGFPGGFPGGGGMGMGGGSQLYASVIEADDKLFAVTRGQGTYVIAADPTFKVVAQNKIDGDSTNFDATPAVSNGQIFLRSNAALYCIGSK